VPAKDFDIKNFIDDDDEVDMKQLARYISDETRVGECIENTMYNTKFYLNKQYANMKRLFELEQEKIRKEREASVNATVSQKGSLFSRFFSGTKTTTNKNMPKNEITEIKPDEDSKAKEKDVSNYLISMPEPTTKSANLLEIIDESTKDTDQPSNSQNHVHKVPQKADPSFEEFDQNGLYHQSEKEVPMHTEEDKEIRDDETNQSETCTLNENVRNEDEQFKVAKRSRSDSISSTSTSKMYKYSDFSDFINVDELHKFMYK
jgi:hypothetical protein